MTVKKIVSHTLVASLLVAAVAVMGPVLVTDSAHARQASGAADAVTSSAKGPKAKYMRKKVRLSTRERPGTIIVDTNRKFLYYVEPNGRATRYGVGVGRDGFGWAGTVKVGRKAEWPDWRPPPQMIAREKKKGRIIPAYMPGGVDNPLGARALYLYKGGRDTIYRIHGTNQPWTIGQNMSSGCIRMMNSDVKHLYKRAGVGTKVVVIGAGSRSSRYYTEQGVDVLGTIETIFRR